MILVDTSVWIDLLGKNRKFRVEGDQILSFATCPPILQEIFQGIRDDRVHGSIGENLLALPRLADPVPLEDYLNAAALYRMGRRKGHTIRSSVDCLIAAIAIREKIPVWHQDRDFDILARYSDLRIFSR